MVHTYEPAVQGRFIRLTTVSVGVPGDDGKPGEVHDDVGFFSFDPERKKLVLRQYLKSPGKDFFSCRKMTMRRADRTSP